jgi:DNA (cytosine-5)-methyltransferase 1
MTVGSLFSGIGGFDLGFERAGFAITWQVEIDPFCRAVLAKHWPSVRRYDDVRTVGSDLRAVDVICGGFPCQPHSVAGRRQGSTDERDLWGEFARIIREVRPRWVVAENVPGLLSSESGRFFGRVLRDLAESGYDAEWDCISATDIGAPHRRGRVWIVATCSGLRYGRILPVQSEAGQVSDTNGWRCEVKRISEPARIEGSRWSQPDGCGEVREQQYSEARPTVFGEGQRIDRALASSGWWDVEPNVGRVAHGVPARVDRLRSLGNAIVPQIAEWIARRILTAEALPGGEPNHQHQPPRNTAGHSEK